jgi:sialate O-acetylesterase
MKYFEQYLVLRFVVENWRFKGYLFPWFVLRCVKILKANKGEMLRCRWILVLIIFIVEINAQTRSFLSRTLGSNMTLQREKKASIYGYTSEAQTSVTCSFDGNEYTTLSSNQKSINDGSGYLWIVQLPEMIGSFTEYEIMCTSSEGENVHLKNILFGDVYLCGGQSNMEMTVAMSYNNETEIADADNYPYIRLFTVGM